MRAPDYTLPTEHIAVLRSPLVYVFSDSDSTPLYVGVSIKGAGRPLDPTHHAIGRHEGGRIDLYCCTTPEEAIALERQMIKALAPAWNKRIGNWQAYTKVNRRFVSRVFPSWTPLDVMRQWRIAQRGTAAREKLANYLATLQD